MKVVRQEMYVPTRKIVVPARQSRARLVVVVFEATQMNG